MKLTLDLWFNNVVLVKRKKSKFYYMLDIFVILEQNFKFLATVLFVLSRSS